MLLDFLQGHAPELQALVVECFHVEARAERSLCLGAQISEKDFTDAVGGHLARHHGDAVHVVLRLLARHAGLLVQRVGKWPAPASSP